MKAQLQRNPHFAVRASVDSQEGERAYLETVADSRDLRKKKMVRDYACKGKTEGKGGFRRRARQPKREAARYRETSEVAEESLDGFSRGDQRQIEEGTCAERTAEKEFPDYRLAMKVMAWYMEPVSVSEVLHLP